LASIRPVVLIAVSALFTPGLLKKKHLGYTLLGFCAPIRGGMGRESFNRGRWPAL
jgi:hypothetical protein